MGIPGSTTYSVRTNQMRWPEWPMSEASSLMSLLLKAILSPKERSAGLRNFMQWRKRREANHQTTVWRRGGLNPAKSSTIWEYGYKRS